jgi:aminoglycoside phosphotransferase (APT) family kinase protein
VVSCRFSASLHALNSAGLVDSHGLLTLLGEGFGSAALESENGVVILVAKNEIGARARRVCVSLLPEVSHTLPCETPKPLWSVDSVPGMPWGAWAYRKIPGNLLTDANAPETPLSIAEDIGRFVAALHKFPVGEAVKAGVPEAHELHDDLHLLHAQIGPALRHRLRDDEYSRVEDWWRHFLEASRVRLPLVLTHGDLFPQNLLVSDDSSRLTGVLDWGDAAIADAAYDFATLQVFGSPFSEVAMSSYLSEGGSKPEGFEGRVHIYWELRSSSFFSLRASIREKDEAELQKCLQELRDGPLLA